jgi:hypothetical protein
MGVIVIREERVYICFRNLSFSSIVAVQYNIMNLSDK